MASIGIASRRIGPGEPTFIVGEMSCNHGQHLNVALDLIRAAKDAGADAVKIQAYDAGSMTLCSDAEPFQMRSGPWAGRTLWDLYSQGATPWEWLPTLKAEADRIGIILFPSVFAVEDIPRVAVIDPPAYKVASFELSDTRLIRALARQGKPLILSTGMATMAEIGAAIDAADDGMRDRVYLPSNRVLAAPASLALLKCTSAYPASVCATNLRTIYDGARHAPYSIGEYPALLSAWGFYPIGLSDHSCSNAVVSAAITLGACIVERHLKLLGTTGPDAAFSDTPDEFAAMVRAIRDVESALGTVRYGPTESERPMLRFRRSLWAVRDIVAGEALTTDNVRSLRPEGGLPPAELSRVIGKRARLSIARGMPLSWNLLEA